MKNIFIRKLIALTIVSITVLGVTSISASAEWRQNSDGTWNYDNNGISLGTFSSCAELSRQSQILFGVKLNNSKICDVCNNKRKTHYGFIFKYLKENVI